MEHMKGRLDLLRKAREKNVLRKAKEKDLLRKTKDKVWEGVRGRGQDRVRKVEEDVHSTVRTIGEEKQEGVLRIWGGIKGKIKAGFWK